MSVGTYQSEPPESELPESDEEELELESVHDELLDDEELTSSSREAGEGVQLSLLPELKLSASVWKSTAGAAGATGAL